MFTSQSKRIEPILESLFPSPGFFLEIGAWSGENISQTAYLERQQRWTGICVDPFPRDFEHRSCQVCARAISRDGLPRAFLKVSIDRRYGGDVSYFSGFKESVMRGINWPLIQEHCNYEEIQLETITIAQLYELYDLPRFIEFLSIDIEGGELEFFESMDFNAHQFGLIAFEHNMNDCVREAIGRILTAHGYRLFQAWDYDDLYICRATDENPLLRPGNKQLEW